jgi:hypothetical protein
MAGSSPKEANMADDPRKAEHDQRVKALNEANLASAKAQQMPPTPTQEENDLFALGLMHPDEKDASNPKDEADRSPRPPSDPHRPAPEPHSTSTAAARRS